MKRFYSLGYLINLMIVSCNGQNISSVCASRDEELNGDRQVIAAAVLMGTGYPEVPQPTDPVEIRTIHNWGAISSNPIYKRMANECEGNAGHALCTVKTVTKFSQDIRGQAATNFVTEIEKPVCFPPTCTDLDVPILEAQPGRCDPSSNIRPCEIISYEVKCPINRPLSDGICTQTLNTLTSPYFIQRNVLEGRIRSGCPQNIAVSGSTEICSVEVGDFILKSMRDYADKESDDDYIAYVRQCTINEGKMCEVNMTTTQQAERQNIGTVELHRSYTGLPVCMAQDCSGDDESKIVKKRFSDNISGVPCDLTDGSCVVNIQSLNCNSTSLSPTFTAAPTPTNTPAPTSSPLVQLVSDTCQVDHDELSANLRIANVALTTNYPDVPEPSDPILVETTQHWDQLSDTNIYSRMKRDCEENLNYTFCTVNTKVEYSQELVGQAATNTIYEKNKPVCFPPNCRDSDVPIIEDEPARCDTDTFPCSILSYDLNCPVGRPIDQNPSNPCQQTLDTLTNPFFIGRNILEGRVQTNCASGGGRLCTVETGEVVVRSSRNYAGHETDSAYLEYERLCGANNGRICHVDMVVQAKSERAENTVGLSVKLRRALKDMPICVSSQCGGIEIEEVIKDRIPGCDLNAGTCTMDLTRIECVVPTKEPTMQPTRAPAQKSSVDTADTETDNEDTGETDTTDVLDVVDNNAASSGSLLVSTFYSTFFSASIALLLTFS